MLSATLVRLIEDNWEEIATRLIAEIRKNPNMRELAKCSDLELREWCREILENLGHLLLASKGDALKRRYQILGRVRFEENIPLHEAVLRFHLLKEKIIGFVHDQGYGMSPLQLYAEEELEQRMGRFFDSCIYHIVRGYEHALRGAHRFAS